MISQQLDRGSASEMATVVPQVGGLEQVRIRHGVYDINVRLRHGFQGTSEDLRRSYTMHSDAEILGEKELRDSNEDKKALMQTL